MESKSEARRKVLLGLEMVENPVEVERRGKGWREGVVV